MKKLNAASSKIIGLANNSLLKLIFMPAVLMLSACSTTYTPETDKNPNYNFNDVKSYYVIGDERQKKPMFSDIDRARLEGAIDDSMQQLGKLKEQESEADILISYFVVTKDKVKVNSSYSGNYSQGCYRCWPSYGAGVTHISTRDYVEGTLVLDIIDNDTKRSVYRSKLVKPLKSFETLQEREQAMNNMVKEMMKSIPQV